MNSRESFDLRDQKSVELHAVCCGQSSHRSCLRIAVRQKLEAIAQREATEARLSSKISQLRRFNTCVLVELRSSESRASCIFSMSRVPL